MKFDRLHWWGDAERVTGCWPANKVGCEVNQPVVVVR